MDFQSKNFSYVSKTFGEFIEQADTGEKLYLRSLSSEKPSELPADIERDFPSIAADFKLPPELTTIIENAHSSPLRISGPVIMWLHYDVSLIHRYLTSADSHDPGDGKCALPDSSL
jgi:tRNA wybutosine-synthesizing protein 4